MALMHGCAPREQAGRQACSMHSELYRVVLARRLRVPLLGAAGVRPKCGACPNVFLDHALVCGDRALRRNAARNAFHTQACAAGLRADKEEPVVGSPHAMVASR